MSYWLMKSEPNVYGIDHLERDGQTLWDGVRNYQARNYLLAMQPDDIAFFYHSNVDPPGIVGLMRVVQTKVVDPSQFEQQSHYYDARATPEQPRWHTVRVAFMERFSPMLTLETLKATFAPEDLLVVRRGNRLSVMPVADPVAQRLLALSNSQTLF